MHTPICLLLSRACCGHPCPARLCLLLRAKEYLKRWGFHRLQRVFGPPEGRKPDETPDLGSTTPARLVPQLPDPVADFVGREDQIAKITTRLRQQKGAAISAIGGQGGVGKTELAYYVAREVRDDYPDGQVQINLRGLDAEPVTPAEAMRDVLLRLAPEQKLPDSDQHLAELYRGLLGERRVLILADNAKDSAQVAPIVPNPPSALLVTSRQPIPLPGVEAVDLEQLAPPEAVKLLRDIVGEGRASDDEIARLAELCGYLPLALRAAGERLAGSKALSTPAYLEKLEHDRGDLRYRGREVMAVLAESVEALEHDQPELVEKWRSLAVFPAPFDRKAGEAVGELDADGAGGLGQPQPGSLRRQGRSISAARLVSRLSPRGPVRSGRVRRREAPRGAFSRRLCRSQALGTSKTKRASSKACDSSIANGFTSKFA